MSFTSGTGIVILDYSSLHASSGIRPTEFSRMYFCILNIHWKKLNTLFCVFDILLVSFLLPLQSSAKPADWKYQNGLSASWLSLECTINANIHIPLSATLPSHDLEKNTRVRQDKSILVTLGTIIS